MSGKLHSRRTVVKGAVAASVGLPYFVPSGVLAAPGRPGANDRIVYGHIGVGGMGRNHVVPNSCAAICDVDSNHLAEVAKTVQGSPQGRIAAAEIDAVLREAHAEDVGLILRLLQDPYTPMTSHAEVIAALNTSLSRVGPNDRVPLPNIQRETLRAMVVGSKIDLALAVLSAFEHIGNAGDCATVSRVVSGASPVQSEQVMERAKKVLPAMEERIRRARAGTGLLRASSAPDGDTLLRAHTPPPDEHAETLMRAVE